MVTTMLGFANIDVTTAGTIAEAWELGLIGNFDLYLLDSRFPDGSGLELCRRLHALDPKTPVVFYSGDVYEKDVRNGLDAGAKAYLAKPYMHDLSETILRTIGEAKKYGVKTYDSSFAEARRKDEVPAPV
jgi:DNA-binding response OmpR family regulator